MSLYRCRSFLLPLLPSTHSVDRRLTAQYAPPASIVMRKTIATVIILGLVWIGYTSWPIYDPIGAVTRYGDPRCANRDAARVLRCGTRVAHESSCRCLHSAHRSQHQSARAKCGRCLGIADPIVKKLISPAALSELLGVSWPVTVVPDPPPGTVGITESTIGTIWQIFGNSEYGLARFEVTAPFALPQQQRFRLTFRSGENGPLRNSKRTTG
jgi:hypothetical protein